MQFKFKTCLAVGFLLLSAAFSYSQWTSNTGVNNAVSDTTGDQATPKISATSDGGCYIMWFDNRSSNYAVYLQKYDAAGNKLFGSQGLLISNNTQNSSLQDFNITTDASDNAVLVFTDRRNGTILNPFAYLISPNGTFLWGANGVSLTDSTTVSQNIPVVTATSDGNYVFAWVYINGRSQIAMQKLNAAGVPQWGPAPKKIQSGTTFQYNYPKLTRSDNGSIIMIWDSYTGNLVTTSNIKILIQKFDPSGSIQWSNPQDTVQNIGRVSGISYQPYLVSDGNNGCVISWQEDRNADNRANVYVQRYSSSGSYYFPKNGSEGSLDYASQHFQPTASYVSSSGDTYMFWTVTNGGQTVVGGLYGQRFDASGNRQWTDNAKEFKGLDNNQLSFISTFTRDTNVVVTYTEAIFGSANANVKALRTGPSSVFHWSGNIVTASSYLSGKIRKQAMLDPVYGNSIMTWSDNRSGNGDIYAQMIKFNGEAGVCSVSLKAGIEGFWNGSVQVSDTVTCVLRNSTSPYNIVESSRTVLNSNGEGVVSFPSAPAGSYYLVAVHRNSIETWSGLPVTLVKGSNSYDFTSAASQAYGNNQTLKSGRYCIYSGDVNQDGAVDGADGGLTDNDAFNFVTGYVATDVNGDNSTDASDLAIVDNNAFNFVGVSRP
ncbi:MAG: hypothetical protein K1X85_03235 [Ignavibacteria bacterium]|nr:hypothetical protein [Ignavibacteria bacterium]